MASDKPQMAGRILIAGVGNIFLADDGFGTQVAKRLSSMNLPQGVRVADYGISGLHLAYDIAEGYDAVILIDATSSGSKPGTVTVTEVNPEHRRDSAAGGAPTATPVFDAHGMQPDVVFGVLDMLGAWTGRIFVVGCEPGAIDYRIGLSEPVEAAVEEAVRIVMSLIVAAGHGPSISARPGVSPPASLPPPSSLSATSSISAPPDISPPPSISAPPKLTPPPSISAPPSVSAPPAITPRPSVSAPPKLTPPPSISAPPSVSAPPKLTPPPSLVPPPRLTPPPDLSPPQPGLSGWPSVSPPPSPSSPPRISPPPEISATPEISAHSSTVGKSSHSAPRTPGPQPPARSPDVATVTPAATTHQPMEPASPPAVD